jgi:hypothetical protein
MNIKKYMIAFVLVLILMVSCSDSFLDEGNDPGKETDGTFWTSEENVMRGLVAVYNPIRDEMYGYYGAYSGIWNNSMRADDLFPTRNEERFAWEILTFTNTSETKDDPWSKLYMGIQLANEFLYSAPSVAMDGATLKQMMGEAYFLRGFQFFLLQENYGGAVIRILPQKVDSEQRGWSSQAGVLAQCESDFNAAIEALPVMRPANENGRITKGAAIAMLGKTYLWEGKYAEAKAQFELIMSSPYTYDLTENYEDNFRNTTEFNRESIYEIDYGYFGDPNSTWGNSVGTNAFMGNNLANFFGPQLPNGGGWYKMQPAAHLVSEFVSEPRQEGSDTKWDKRFYTTCYFKYSDYGDVKPDETWYGNVDFDTMWGSAGTKVVPAPQWKPIDGVPGRFIFKKITAWWAPAGCTMYGGNEQARDNNLRVMRFAEILFLHAEACLQTNNVSNAMTDINRIRVRAGLPQKNISDTDVAWIELRKQKLLEFCAENLRWYDLIRWYDDSTLKNYLIKTKDAGQSPYNYQPKHRFLPIPQAEVDANVKLDQKPEWQ